MSGTARSSARSTASGKIKTENPALVKLLTSDSLTDTRFVAAEHSSPVNTSHAYTNVNANQGSTNSPHKTRDNRPNSRYSEIASSENIIETEPKTSTEKGKIDNRPDSRYSDKISSEKTEKESRPNSRYSVSKSAEKESSPDSRYSGKGETKSTKEISNDSSWGNVDESLTFDITNVDNQNIDQTSPSSTVNKNNRENTLDRYTDRVISSKSGQNTPSKIDFLKVERVESPNFERTRSREGDKSPGGTSQSYSSSRLKNLGTASKQHPYLEARSASQLIDPQSGEGFEGDSLDVDSGLVPDTTSLLESAPDTGRQTYRVPTPPTPVTKNVPRITSADSSRFRSDSRTSQQSISANSATGVAPPQLDRTESVVSDNGIPPPSNLNYSGNLPRTDEDSVDREDFSPKRAEQRKSAVSFKEPVISDYHSHTEGREADDWDTPRERIPTPHPASPQKYQDSLDFDSGRTSNLSPEPTHQSETDIPSALYSQTAETRNQNNSAKSASGRSVKKVYIDSPTFTKEEEEEFRFVESRLDDMNEDLEDTVRRIEEQGNRYKQEREAMNEEAARLRAEIQATEGYSNSLNRNTDERYRQQGNYSDNHSKPVTHPSDEMDTRSYGRSQDQDTRQDRYQNGYSNTQGYGNLRDSRDVYNTRNDRYEDRNVDDRDGYSRNQGGFPQEQEGYSRNQGGYSQNQGGYSRDQGGQGRYDGYSQNQGGQGRDDGYSQNQGGYSRNQGGQGRDDGYSQNQGGYGRDSDPYAQEQEGYSRKPDDQYSRRQDDQYGGQQYDRRGASPSRYPNGEERGDDELQRETQYQEDLRHRLDSDQKHDSELVIPNIPLNEDQFRDSLDENGYSEQRNFARDSLDQEGYGNWGNPPPNPFGQGKGEHSEYLNKPQDQPDFVDENDTARMELLHPKEPRVDYVEENKFTYGLAPNKSYKNIKVKEKETEQKLNDIFIHPKKPGKKHKRTIPLSNEERRPPLTELKENDVGAEGVWAKRSAQLAKHKDGKVTASGTIKKSRGLQKFPSESGINSNQGQIYQGQGGRMYGTPTRNQYLEPLGYKPQSSKEDPQQSPSYRDGSFKKPLELHPIKTEITTDDGQKISVDINLKVLSPTLQRRIKSHPDDSPESGAPPFNVHAEVKQNRSNERRPVGMQYQLANRGGGDQTRNQYQNDGPSRQSPQSQGSRQYPIDTQDSRPYQDQPPLQVALQDSYRGNDYDGIDEEALRKQEEALMAELNLSPNPYAKIPPIPIRDELTVPVIMEKGGYAAMYQDSKDKDPNQEPWYQVYTVKDFKKMQKEVRLNRGTLGPDLDNETYKEKMEKRHKQFEYARMVMEKNKQDLHEKKPSFPRRDPQTEEQEKSKRKAALDYAKNVPRPAVKQKPNQYNSYEVASQLSPIAKPNSTGSKSPTHTQNMDVIDLKKLQQRHEQEKKNVAMMRSNLETVPQKA